MEERLQKIMARAGLGSRRANEDLIRAGRVRVNGRVARLGDRADPERDLIEVDSKPIESDPFVYVMLNKPRGVLSSTEDELGEGRPTVRDLVDIPGHVYPVGRLDKQSEGLILLTNDGQLAHRLTHPRFEHEKLYEATLEGATPVAMLEEWRAGVMLEGEMTAPAEITVMSQTDVATHLQITLREGRKRQIRRIAAMYGHPVTRLVRTRIGPLTMNDVAPGEWRRLTKAEINALREAVSGPSDSRRGRH
jgi:pseudouridine synthase